ncbi:MAG: hypothetical protein HY735_22790 [Verrucomicrobia bacterium]|nr:hypothetical protein [Verrucomicrobiota bacterium]
MQFIGFEHPNATDPPGTARDPAEHQKRQRAKEQLERCVKEILGKLFDNRAGFPTAKREKLIKLIFENAKVYYGGRLCDGSLNGYTYPADQAVHICPTTFGENPGRVCAVLFHELIHATGEGEFDAEAFENLFYPPSTAAAGGNAGGTWPYNDCADFCRDTRLRGDGLRETDNFVWDPSTGEVWRRNADGSKGSRLWDDPDIQKLWRCDCGGVRREKDPRAPYVDKVEPGDKGYTRRPEREENDSDDELEELLRALEALIAELRKRASRPPGTGETGKPPTCGGYPHEGGGTSGGGSSQGTSGGYPHEGTGKPGGESGAGGSHGYPHESGSNPVFIDRKE